MPSWSLFERYTRWDRYFDLARRTEPPQDGRRWTPILHQVQPREGQTECTAENVIDVLRGLVDTGVMNPDDVVMAIMFARHAHDAEWWCSVEFWHHSREEVTKL